MSDPAVMRSVGGFTADVTIEEDATDELEITRQPVEQGATITDHSYKLPATIILKAAWSNSSAQADGDPNFTANTYQDLLDLQVSREPFEVQTGKRLYSNMLMRELRQITNEDSEYALVVTFTLQQVILAQTQVTSVPPTQNQSSPQDTGGVTDNGTQQLQGAPTYNPTGGPQ